MRNEVSVNQNADTKHMDVDFSRNPANPSTPVVEVQSVATPVPGVTVEATNTVAPAPAALATIPKAGLPTKSTFLLGDVLPDFSDMVIPRVNIVQNIGTLSESFQSGSLLYGQQVVLFTPAVIDVKSSTIKQAATPPVNVTFFGFRPTRFAQKLPGGAKGLLVNTEDEVRAAGGTLDYAEFKLKEASGMTRFEPLADAMVAIQRPDALADDDTIFVYDIERKKYALALWAVRGTAYTNLCKKTLFPARRMGALRQGGYPSWSYSLSTREEKYPGGHAAWIPVALPREKNTPAFLDFVREIIGG